MLSNNITQFMKKKRHNFKNDKMKSFLSRKHLDMAHLCKRFNVFGERLDVCMQCKKRHFRTLGKRKDQSFN